MEYNLVLADPPWFYNERKLKRVDGKSPRFGKGAVNHYSVMSTEEICDLPVKDIVADNCALFLWTTFPRLDAGLKVMQAWGFDYKTIGFLWVKLNPKRVNHPGECEVLENRGMYSYLNWLTFFGIGYYTKSNPEPCLLGIRGRMKPISNKVSNVIYAPRGQHSEKPFAIRHKIVELFGDLPRVELFARQTEVGWDSWGAEVENDLEF